MTGDTPAPLHVCYLCDEYPPGPHGGIGSYTQTIGRALVDRGHRVTSVGIYAVPSIQIDDDRGVKVVRLPHAEVPRTGVIVHGSRLRRALRRLHAEQPFDVLEGPELSFALVPRRFPVVKIVRLNGGHHFFAVTLGRKPQPWRSWLERRSFSRADYISAVSRFVAHETRPLLKLDGIHIEVIPNPVDTAHFRVSAPAAEEDALIVFVGTLTEKKGVRELVQGFPAIRRAVPGARLLLVGRDSIDPRTGGSFAAGLQSLVSADDWQRIELAGHVGRPDLPGVLARATVAAFPSHMESQGLVIIEAMAGSKAVVTGQVGPGPELIEDGVSGLLCDPHDPASIAGKIIAALKDRPLRRQLGAAASERAEQLFSIPVIADRMAEYYRGCIANGSRH